MWCDQMRRKLKCRWQIITNKIMPCGSLYSVLLHVVLGNPADAHCHCFTFFVQCLCIYFQFQRRAALTYHIVHITRITTQRIVEPFVDINKIWYVLFRFQMYFVYKFAVRKLVHRIHKLDRTACSKKRNGRSETWNRIG